MRLAFYCTVRASQSGLSQSVSQLSQSVKSSPNSYCTTEHRARTLQGITHTHRGAYMLYPRMLRRKGSQSTDQIKKLPKRYVGISWFTQKL